MNKRSVISNRSKKHYVYALLDALGIEVYIGQTSSPRTRLRAHHSSPCGWRLREAILHGCRFRMRILSEHATGAEACDEEARQIALRLAAGATLLNVAQNEGNNPRGPITRWTTTSRWWHERAKEAGYPEKMWR